MHSSHKPINFEYLDFEIREKDLVYFKNSIDQGCIRKANQTGKSRWNYLIKFESNLVELEVHYNSKNIKSFVCGCGAKSPGKYCKHALIASIWHFQNIHVNVTPASIDFKNKFQTFNNFSKEDLSYVLSALCQNNGLNKQWVHFILTGRSITEKPFSKYTQLLLEINHFLEVSSKNPATRLKNKLDILEELYQISFYHYNHSNIEEATESLLAGIHFIHCTADYTLFKNFTKLIQMNDKLHTAFLQFSQLIVAPGALNKIQKLTYDCATSKEYLILNKNSNLFDRLLSKKSFFQQFIKDGFKPLLLKIYYSIPDDFKFTILDYLYQINPEQLSDLLLKHELNYNFYTSLNWLNSRKVSLPTSYLVNYYKRIYSIAAPDLKKYIGQLYLKLLISSDQKPLDEFLLLFYMDSKDSSFLKLYFTSNHTPEAYIEATNFLLKNTATTILSKRTTLDLSFYSHQYTVFFEELQKTDDLHLLEIYDLDLPEELAQEYIKIYILFFDKYLNEHAGYQANQKLELSLRRIKNNFSKNNYLEFSNSIKRLFPDRKLIKQILN